MQILKVPASRPEFGCHAFQESFIFLGSLEILLTDNFLKKIERVVADTLSRPDSG